MPKWVRKALQISEPVREFSGTTHVGAAETLAIVFHEVCVSCNTGWMETLETITRPVLGPLLLGAAPNTSRMLDPDQQAILATWAVKTSLLLTLSKFRGQEHGWIPVTSLQWLHQHHGSRMPPPGTRVWMAGLSTSDIPASVQAACLYDADGEATAQCVTFSAGCVLFQVLRPGRRTRISRRTPKPGSRPRGRIGQRCCRSPRPARRSGGRPRPCSAPGTGKLWPDGCVRGFPPGGETGAHRVR